MVGEEIGFVGKKVLNDDGTKERKLGDSCGG